MHAQEGVSLPSLEECLALALLAQETAREEARQQALHLQRLRAPSRPGLLVEPLQHLQVGSLPHHPDTLDVHGVLAVHSPEEDTDAS